MHFSVSKGILNYLKNMQRAPKMTNAMRLNERNPEKQTNVSILAFSNVLNVMVFTKK